LGARAKDFMDGVNGSNSFQQGSQGSQVADTHKIVNGFDLWKRIGKGSFGEVWMVTKKNEGDVYAMKILEKERKFPLKKKNIIPFFTCATSYSSDLLKLNVPQRAVSEKKILQKINSPFVISLKWAFQDKKHLYLVLDYVGGGDLFHLYRRVAPNCFSEAAARFYAVELSLALEHLHQQDIVFRDLKLENVLVGLDGHIKLTDFGVAKQSLFRSHTFVGTPQYMAPEIIHRKPHGAEVDWWAMGMRKCHLPLKPSTTYAHKTNSTTIIYFLLNIS
jgi:serine/threonine protein kinase